MLFAANETNRPAHYISPAIRQVACVRSNGIASRPVTPFSQRLAEEKNARFLESKPSHSANSGTVCSIR